MTTASPPQVLDAIATNHHTDATALVFEYMAATMAETGRPVPADIDQLPSILRAECEQLETAYQAPGALLLVYRDRHPIGCVGLKPLPEPGTIRGQTPLRAPRPPRRDRHNLDEPCPPTRLPARLPLAGTRRHPRTPSRHRLLQTTRLYRMRPLHDRIVPHGLPGTTRNTEGQQPGNRQVLTIALSFHWLP